MAQSGTTEQILNDLFVHLESEPVFRAALEELVVKNNKQAAIIQELDGRLLDMLVGDMRNLHISQPAPLVPGGEMQQIVAGIEDEIVALRNRIEQLGQRMLEMEEQLRQRQEQQQQEELANAQEQGQSPQQLVEQQGSLQQYQAHINHQLGELEMLLDELELGEQQYEEAVADQAQFQAQSVVLFDELMQLDEEEAAGQQLQVGGNWNNLLEQGYDEWDFVSLPEEVQQSDEEESLHQEFPEEEGTQLLPPLPEQDQPGPSTGEEEIEEGEENGSNHGIILQQPQYHQADPNIEEEEEEENVHPAGNQQYREIVLRTRRILVPIMGTSNAPIQPGPPAFALPDIEGLPARFRNALVEPSTAPYIVLHDANGGARIECRLAGCGRSFGSIRGWRVHVARIHRTDGFCTSCGRFVAMPPNADEEARQEVMAAHTSEWCPRPSMATTKERQVKRRRLEMLGRNDEAAHLYLPE